MMSFPDPNSLVCSKILEKTELALIKLSNSLKIATLSRNFLKEIVIPLAVYFNSLERKKDPYFIGFTGGQGSGKTTLSEFVQLVLQIGFDKKTIGFSLDDIYKTPEEREEDAKNIHPLCRVRGVPGTHDIQLGLDTLDSLCSAVSSTLTSIPGVVSIHSSTVDKKVSSSFESTSYVDHTTNSIACERVQFRHHLMARRGNFLALAY